MKTTEELWAAMEAAGATGLYSKFLHGLPLQDMEPVFRGAALAVKRPELVAPLILEDNWRVSLLGGVLAALICEESLVAPLTDRLAKGSFVGPQLAAVIASIYRPDSELPRLRALLDHADPKTSLSVAAALLSFNDPAAHDFVKTQRFVELWQKDDTRCFMLTSKWRGVWSIVGPHFRHSIGWVDPKA